MKTLYVGGMIEKLIRLEYLFKITGGALLLSLAMGCSAKFNNPKSTSSASAEASALSISDSVQYSFGAVQVGSYWDRSLTVTPASGKTAEAVAVSGLSGPLSFVGGTYPGTGGTCGSTIASECTVAVRFSPTSAGTIATQNLTLEYTSSGVHGRVSRAITGTGVSPTGDYFTDIYAGGSGYQEIRDARVDALGNIYIAGWNAGTMDLNGTTLTSTTSTNDIFIAKLNSSGTPVWAVQYSGAGNDRAWVLEYDSSGYIYVYGSYSGTIDFGTGALAATGTSDLFLLKLRTSDGSTVWAKHYGFAGVSNTGNSIALTPTGEIWITGSMRGALNFGGALTNTTPGGGTSDLVLSKYSSSGSYLWSKSWGGSGGDYNDGWLTLDNAGYVYMLGGSSSPTLSFGGATHTNLGSADTYLIKLSP